MTVSVRNADQITVRLLDGLVMFWLVLWIVVGVWSGIVIWQVSDLGDTITNSGDTLGVAGKALTALGQVPVVGDSAGQLGAQVAASSADIAARGGEIKSQLRELALLLGVSIVMMPTTPVVGLYLPLRIARRREQRDVRDALRAHGRDPGLDRYLAERALRTLPYAAVRAVSDDPWADIAVGRTRALADIELRRLGLRSDSLGG